MADQTGIRFGLANSALVLALLVAAVVRLNHVETALVALLVAGAASGVLPRLFAIFMGVVSWAYFTGFFENRYGVLTLAPNDLLNLASFVIATVVIAGLVRRILEPARRVRVDE